MISWACWYLRPHCVSELNALTRSPSSVTQTCFNCESKCFWYEIYWAGKGKEEQGQHSLPSFDRGMEKISKVYVKDFFFFLNSLPIVTLLNMYPVWCFKTSAWLTELKPETYTTICVMSLKKCFHHDIKAVNEFVLKIDKLQFVMKWSFQLVGIGQHNTQDKVTKLKSSTILADKMTYSSKEFTWYPLCNNLGNLICNVLFKLF